MFPKNDFLLGDVFFRSIESREEGLTNISNSLVTVRLPARIRSRLSADSTLNKARLIGVRIPLIWTEEVAKRWTRSSMEMFTSKGMSIWSSGWNSPPHNTPLIIIPSSWILDEHIWSAICLSSSSDLSSIVGLNWSSRCPIALDASLWHSDMRNDSLPGENRDRLNEFFENFSDLPRGVTSIDAPRERQIDIGVDEFDSDTKEKRVSWRRISFVHWLERDVLRRLFQRIFCWSRLDEVSYWMFIAEEHFHGDIVQSISDVNTKVLFHSSARRRVQLRRVLHKFPRSQSKAEDIADLLHLDIRLSIERWRERDWHCIFGNFCSEKLNRSATKKKKKEMTAVSVQSFRFLCRWTRRRNASRCSSNRSPPFKYNRTPFNAVERSKVCKTILSSVIRALTAKDTAGWMLLVVVRSTRERETSVAVVLVLFLAILDVDLHLFEIEISWHEEIQLFQSIASFIDVQYRSYETVDCSGTKFNSLFFIFLALLLETFRKAWKSPNVSPVKWNWLLKEMPCREEGEEWRDSWERDRQQCSLFHRPDQRRVPRRSNETIRDRSVRKPQSFLRRSDHHRTGESRLDPFEWSMPRAEILDSHNSNVLSEGEELLSVEEWSLRSRSDSDQASSVSPGDSLDRENVGPKQLPDRERTIVWRCHWSQLAFVAQTN